MPISFATKGQKQVDKFLRELHRVPRQRQQALTRKAGRMARDETKKKILAGNFEGPSKWVRARKGVNKSLRGVAKNVVMKVQSNNRVVIESSDPRYTLKQHAEGYTKPAGSGGKADRVDGNWVVIPLANPSALNKPVSNPFMFDWTVNKRPSVVPARNILPEDRVLAHETEKVAERWLNEVIKEAARRAGVLITT